MSDRNSLLSIPKNIVGSRLFTPFTTDLYMYIPEDVSFIHVFGCGGGGGGGNSGGGNGGSGGAGAPIIETVVSVNPGSRIQIEIGLGGSAHVDGTQTAIRNKDGTILIAMPGGYAAVTTTIGSGQRGSLNGIDGFPGTSGGAGGSGYVAALIAAQMGTGAGGLFNSAQAGGGGGSISSGGNGGTPNNSGGNGFIGGGGGGGSHSGGLGGQGGDGQLTIRLLRDY